MTDVVYDTNDDCIFTFFQHVRGNPVVSLRILKTCRPDALTVDEYRICIDNPSEFQGCRLGDHRGRDADLPSEPDDAVHRPKFCVRPIPGKMNCPPPRRVEPGVEPGILRIFIPFIILPQLSVPHSNPFVILFVYSSEESRILKPLCVLIVFRERFYRFLTYPCFR